MNADIDIQKMKDLVAEQACHPYLKNTSFFQSDKNHPEEHLISKIVIEQATILSTNEGQRYCPGRVLIAFVDDATEAGRKAVRESVSHLGHVGGFNGDAWFLLKPEEGVVTHTFVQDTLMNLYLVGAMTGNDVAMAAKEFGIETPSLPKRPFPPADYYKKGCAEETARIFAMVASLR